MLHRNAAFFIWALHSRRHTKYENIIRLLPVFPHSDQYGNNLTRYEELLSRRTIA